MKENHRFENHITSQFNKIREMLEEYGGTVNFAGSSEPTNIKFKNETLVVDPNTRESYFHNFGNGLAEHQFRWVPDVYFIVSAIDDHISLMLQFSREIVKLMKEYPSTQGKPRVTLGKLDPDNASVKNIQVWAANKDNYNLDDFENILGGGQAAIMGIQKPGKIGIITTPMAGFL